MYGIEKVYASLNGEGIEKEVNAVLEVFDKPIVLSVEYKHELKPVRKR